MFRSSRLLLIVLFAVIGTMLMFSRFHHLFFAAAAAMQAEAKAAERLPPGPRDDYKAGIAVSAASAEERPLPDVSRFTIDGVAALAPALRAGKVEIAPVLRYPGLNAFAKKNGDLQRLRLAQRRTRPEAIVISEGSYNFTRLLQAVAALGAPDAIVRGEGGAYLMRLPLFIAPGASLVISDRDLAELRLSREKGVFIANSGVLFILRTKMTGWSERQNAPSLFRADSAFRPFITSWSGSHLYVAGSSLSYLGYQKGQSRGLSFAICRDCLKENQALPPPSGAVVESAFAGMYHGLHAHGASEVAIVGNTFADSVVSGVSLQDRARRLVVAGNEVYGSRESHGISLSGDVSDSWIFDNNSHDNRGDGIALGRASTRNVIANNTCARNDGDGIAFYESSGNATRRNTVLRNGLSGMRLRNSTNISLKGDYIMDNTSVPVVIYTSRPDAPHKDKDGRSTASPHAAARVAGAIIRPSGHRAAFKLEGADRLVLSDVSILAGNPAFSEEVPDNGLKVSAALANPAAEVIVVPASAPSKDN